LKVTGSRSCPDFCGDPPSIAVRSKLISFCFSRSSLFSRANSTLLFSTARINFSLVSRMYLCTSF
uniref:Uncharacterized protein n=1 Tax=Poecilia latipinna TaxID=48699 RepID=A0A3B3UX53_9TELE